METESAHLMYRAYFTLLWCYCIYVVLIQLNVQDALTTYLSCSDCCSAVTVVLLLLRHTAQPSVGTGSSHPLTWNPTENVL